VDFRCGQLGRRRFGVFFDRGGGASLPTGAILIPTGAILVSNPAILVPTRAFGARFLTVPPLAHFARRLIAACLRGLLQLFGLFLVLELKKISYIQEGVPL
jgi:hypothetical protein